MNETKVLIDFERGFIPTKNKDRAAFFFLFLSIPFCIIWDIFVVSPTYFSSLSWSMVIHFAFETFLVINIFGNIYMAIKAELIGPEMNLPSVLKPGWRYCHECQKNYPPRSYHCSICKVCTFRRDHHCAYFGTCISFFNLRYFMVCLLYLWIGTIYALLYYLPFFLNVSGCGFSFFTLIVLGAPHFALIWGYLTLYGFFCTIFLIIICLCVALVTFMLFTQTKVLLSGQTRYEHQHNIHKYDLGLWENLSQTLGTKWYLIWLFPTVSSPIPNDGTSFVEATTFEEPKNL